MVGTLQISHTGQTWIPASTEVKQGVEGCLCKGREKCPREGTKARGGDRGLQEAR